MNEESRQELPAFWTPRRLELREWFSKNAPSLGELYEGALQLLHQKPVCPGSARFVAHAVREVCDRLLYYVHGTGVSQLQYTNRLDSIARKWKQSGFPTDGSVALDSTTEAERLLPTDHVAVPRGVFREVDELIKDHLASRKKPEDVARDLFRTVATESEEWLDQLRPSLLQLVEVRKWFVARVHDSGDTKATRMTEEFWSQFDLFERTLASLVRRFFATTEELDAILEDANR